MGCCLASCAVSSIASCCCTACNGHKSGPMSRLPYLFLLLISGIFATVLSLYGEKHWNLGITEADCEGCAGNASVFRISFCLFVFEFIHLILIAGGAFAFHYSWFGIKLMLYLTGISVCFWAITDNSFFNGYAEFSRFFLSPVFLLIQIVLLITSAFDLNDTILYMADPDGNLNEDNSDEEDGKAIKASEYENNDNDDEGGSMECCKGNAHCWYSLLFLIGFGLYAASFAFLVLFFDWYGGNGCNAHEAVISTCLVFVILNLILSCATSVATGNAPLRVLLVSGIVSMYSVSVIWAGLQGDNTSDHNSDKCNKWANDRDSATLWIGICFSLMSLVYAGLKNNLPSLFFESDPSDMETPLLSGDENDGGSTSSNLDSNYDDIGDDDDSDGKKKRSMNNDRPLTVSDKKDAVCFHLVMLLAAGYMAMLLTNWSVNSDNSSTEKTIGNGTFYANLCCMLCAQFLFYWVLFAPLICKDRFGDNE